MKIWCTSSRYGILNNSTSLPADLKSGCRLVNYKGALFCAYISEGDGYQVKVIVKPSGSGWENPIEVGAESLSGVPSIFVFNDKLYVLCSGEIHPRELTVAARLAAYDDLSGTFTVTDFSTSVDGTPSLVTLNGKLHMFYKELGSRQVLWKSTRDMVTWSDAQVVTSDGATALMCACDPAAISYQGLIHLMARDESSQGTRLLKFDGESAWTRASTLIDSNYGYAPGMTVHNGLLKMAFTAWKKDLNNRAIFQYSYDGNALSTVDISLNLGAKFDVSMAVQDGILYVLYHGQD